MMKTFFTALTAAAMLTLALSPEPADAAGRALIAYFSWSGNTESLAKEIQKETGADIFRIEPQKPYSSSYNTCLEESLRDLNADARPALKNMVKDLAQYDTIYLGFPTWWATLPMPVETFLESGNFSGKVIKPFNSHGGGRSGKAVSAIAKLCPNSQIKDTFSISYGGDGSLQRSMAAWIKK